MKKKIVGRIAEQAVLRAALQSPDPEMVSVVGRRRVGKTFLIKNTYAERIAFEATGLPDGGQTSGVLDELLFSGFISQYYPFGKTKRELLYRLSDEYSLFYLCFIEPNVAFGSDWWQTFSQTANFKSWSGYAFESICLKHVPAIKKALGISGIYTEASSYYLKNSAFGRGVQIDLLLDRKDQAINLFEIKFYQSPFVISKEQAEEFRLKTAIFKTETGTRKQLFFTLLTTFPLSSNEHSLGTVDTALDMNCLFEPF